MNWIVIGSWKFIRFHGSLLVIIIIIITHFFFLCLTKHIDTFLHAFKKELPDFKSYIIEFCLIFSLYLSLKHSFLCTFLYMPMREVLLPDLWEVCTGWVNINKPADLLSTPYWSLSAPNTHIQSAAMTSFLLCFNQLRNAPRYMLFLDRFIECILIIESAFFF